MKKILAVILAVVLVLGLAACGKSSAKEGTPQAALEGFLDAVKDMDFVKMQDYLTSGLSEDDLGMDELPDGFLDMLKAWSKDLKYTIGDAKIDGDDATVHADITYTDASEIIANAMTAYITEAMKLAMSGNVDSITEEEMAQLLFDCIEEETNNTKENKTADVSLDFELENVDGEWKISDLPDEMLDVILSNMLSAMSDFL